MCSGYKPQVKRMKISFRFGSLIRDTVESLAHQGRPTTTFPLVTVCLLAVLTSTAVGRPHDWCATSTDRTLQIEQLQASLKMLEAYDWEMVLIGLDRVHKMTIDAWRFADGILANLVDVINDDEEFINGMANVYLTYASKTPEARRYTDDNSVEKPPTDNALADHLRRVLVEQSKKLAGMLDRLELLHQTERDLGDRRLAELLYGSMGETQFVLCAMHHLFMMLLRDSDQLVPYPKSNLSEFEQDTLGTSHHIRMYAAYGVIQRHSDVIQMVKEDIANLMQQVIQLERR